MLIIFLITKSLSEFDAGHPHEDQGKAPRLGKHL